MDALAQDFAPTDAGQAQGWIDTLAAAGVPIAFIGALAFLGAVLLVLRYFGFLKNGNGEFRAYVESETAAARARDAKVFDKFTDLGEDFTEVRERLAHIEGAMGIDRPKSLKAVRAT